ncbi:OLC1v1001824C1 [Oldenlandia corymbosa var. corymbosa]|uniref:OLC1v1001824C1 n=1 Tax=Oldenlandia corymbosa var. corymbosa TaxID=529605 RepID=A0AAV1D8P3_OLDCO|nr:OLC1v1001824C1 [Oldenlandia corymbosa var. corymbosa]
MSQQQLPHLYSSNSTNNNINSHSNISNLPVSEVYWSLVAKADKKFSKIRDLPYYQRNRYDSYFSKVFKIYTQLWKFQQENRQKLVEAGLKRWEIGDIASRIGQLYFGQYMKTSEASYLSESYIFYEAILTREYFKDGMFQDINIAFKQLRFLARFLTICLVLNRREVVYQLVNQLKMLLDECKRTFQETDFKEWKLVVQEIVKFLKADTSFMNLRPVRYSVVLDLHPDSMPNAIQAKRKLKLRDALLCSYHPHEVKFSELTLDTFRMLQCLEWEPSGSFYQRSTAPSGTAQNGALGPSRMNSSQDMIDPTLPPNPRKAILYRPSVTHLVAVLSTMCEELQPDGILLIYLSASADKGISGQNMSSPLQTGTTIVSNESSFQGHQSNFTHSGTASTYLLNSESDHINPISAQSEAHCLTNHAGSLNIGGRGTGGSKCIYPCDLIPFTRTPIFLVIDSDISRAFKVISGSEKGEPVAILLSPTSPLPIPVTESSRQPSGSTLTIFLAAPLQAFILLLGFTSSDIDMDVYNKADELLSSSLTHWGSLLALSDDLNPVWAQILGDPFLRRLILRFIFCRAVLGLYARTSGQLQFLPECTPELPDTFLPSGSTCQTTVLQLADMFGAANRFTFTEVVLPETGNTKD